MTREQKIRFANTLLAAAGGLVLSTIGLCAWLFGYLLVSGYTLALLLLLFWIVNGLFLAAIYSGYNLRFREPSLTLPQMIWASTCCMVALFITRDLDSAMYMLALLTMMFGVFRVNLTQIKGYCLYLLAGFIIVVLARQYWFRLPASVITILVQWFTFGFCTLAFSRLCGSIVTLRARLRQKNEDLQEALRARSYFLANMSHEIRTPMNGVLGMLEIVLCGDLSVEQRRYLSVAQSSAKGLLTIINDILDFSKMESGKFKLEILEFDLRRLLHEIVETFSALAQENRVNIWLDIDPQTPQTIETDPMRLRQILNNLISNALKFTEQGEVVIAVAVHKPDGRWMLQCEVRDTGIGIAPEKQTQLFDSFTQADASTTRVYGGTGLGLAICKQLCLLLDGNISLQSQPGEGSTFRFTIPVQPAAASGSDQALSRNPYERPPDPAPKPPQVREPPADSVVTPDTAPVAMLQNRAHVRILLVEDNKTNRDVILLKLKAMDLPVDVAQHGQEALDLLHQARQAGCPYSLVLMDCQMPVLDGYETSRAIRASRHADLRHTPIVALTANATDGDSEKCFAAGMNDYIAKPVRSDCLARIVAKYIDTDSTETQATPA